MNEHKAAVKALAFSPSGVLATGGGLQTRRYAYGICQLEIVVTLYLSRDKHLPWFGASQSRELVCAVSQPTPQLHFWRGRPRH